MGQSSIAGVTYTPDAGEMIPPSLKVLVTGASGFVGSFVADKLRACDPVQLTLATRSYLSLADCRNVQVGDISEATDWSAALDSQQVIVHAAACAHKLQGEKTKFESEYFRVNVDGTLNLARQAAAAGVDRFVFISSVSVLGNIAGRAFTENDKPNPLGVDARSKWEAEKGLWEIQRQSNMELTIIRPTIVYGPDAPGNFATLVKWVNSGIPLPLGAIRNRRSLIGIHNLVDLVITCIDHPAAGNQVFLAGDGQDLSTTDLLKNVARSMGKPSRLVSVNEDLLMLVARMLGREELARRLLTSLFVDISKARKLLGWEPPFTVEEGLRRCFN